MDIFHAIILGIVEGITEFIPVSSTGHLIITSHLLGLSGEKVKSFEVFIQLGAILSVVFLYWQRFTGLLDFTKTKPFSGFQAIQKIAVACIPCFVLGAMFHSYIKQHLFSVTTVAAALVVGAILMIVAERKVKVSGVDKLEDVSLKQAFVIGIFQCLALWPGMSRSASTIIGGLFQHIDRKVVAEFSFIVAVPVMFAATLKDLYEALPILNSGDMPVFAVGFIVSFIVALLAIKWFINFLGRSTLIPFAVYRIIAGVFLFYFVT